MLDHLRVVSHGGVVLFSWTSKQLRRDPINQLIRSVLIEDRAGETEFTQDEYKLRWSLANEAQFMVVAVYQSFLKLLCLDALLKEIKARFQAKFPGVALDHNTTQAVDFEAEFEELFEEWKQKEELAAGGSINTAREQHNAAYPEDTTTTAATATPNDSTGSAAGGSQGGKSGSPATAPVSSLGKGTTSVTTAAGRTIGKRGPSFRGAVPKVDKSNPASPTNANPSKRGPKKPTNWNDLGKSTSGGFINPDDEGPEVELTSEQKQAAIANTRKNLISSKNGIEDKMEVDKHKGVERGRVATWFRSRFGQRELDSQDFSIVIPQLRDKLIGKNVAVEIAEKVCESVETALSGKKLGSFESLPEAIEKAMIASLHRILEPRREINILREIAVSRERRKPYSIVFCGVNGVGKSTSVAKVTYWLQQHQQSILLAACDTFRTGAVEQLMVHGDCLDAPVFSQGQSGANTDAAAVAGAALAQATKQGTNVVLIDTAGRMQDHESRMRALAKLIHDNLPDLVLFVGEAVVGNNGIDQLRKFNQCLVDFTPLGRQPRGIDGILLTKFDTCDDKVGATLSMVYELGQPIVFVGVGQQYQDLKTITADVVVNMLMQ